MNKTVTFLVPCYNVAGCVRHCIESMLVDEILDDIEILLVNDGSKDNSLEILCHYEKEYPNSVRVLNKTNGGWGTAINLGIREAKGKYIKEVDADDWVDANQIITYVNELKNINCDYIATEYTEYIKVKEQYEHHTYQKDIYNKQQSLNVFWEQYPYAWDFPIHAITYKRQLLQDICLTVGDRYYGDIEYNLYPLPYVKTICVLPVNVTIYFRGSDEQSTSTQGYAKHYKDYVEMSKRITKFYQSLPNTLHISLHKFITDTVQGTVLKSYNLMLSPVYAGKNEGINSELKEYDCWLNKTDKNLYKYCGHQRKHGVAYIRLWRRLGINLMKLR